MTVAIHPLWRPCSSRANADRQSPRVAHRQVRPGLLQDHQDRWKRNYDEIQQLIHDAIPDLVLGTAHVGSTAVPGLIAKPVIDVDLTVPDVDDERAYLLPLEAIGADGPRRYNDIKSAVVYDIYERAFVADPSHGHDPHPRDPDRSRERCAPRVDDGVVEAALRRRGLGLGS